MARRETVEEKLAQSKIAAGKVVLETEFGEDLEVVIPSWANDQIVLDFKAKGTWFRRKVHIDETVTSETLV